LKYSIEILRSAQKQLAKVNPKDRQRIINVIHSLSDNPRPVNSRKLTGRNAWRIRKGEYRVIYEIYDEKLVILVVVIGHRREVYR